MNLQCTAAWYMPAPDDLATTALYHSKLLLKGQVRMRRDVHPPFYHQSRITYTECEDYLCHGIHCCMLAVYPNCCQGCAFCMSRPVMTVPRGMRCNCNQFFYNHEIDKYDKLVDNTQFYAAAHDHSRTHWRKNGQVAGRDRGHKSRVSESLSFPRQPCAAIPCGRGVG